MRVLFAIVLVLTLSCEKGGPEACEYELSMDKGLLQIELGLALGDFEKVRGSGWEQIVIPEELRSSLKLGPSYRKGGVLLSFTSDEKLWHIEIESFREVCFLGESLNSYHAEDLRLALARKVTVTPIRSIGKFHGFAFVADGFMGKVEIENNSVRKIVLNKDL